MTALRDYQEHDVAAIRAAFAKYRRALYVVVLGYVVAHATAKGNMTIIVAHRAEIADQICAALAAFGVPHGRIQPGYPETPDATVQVAMAISLGRRIARLTEPALLVIDEAHHAVSPHLADDHAALAGAKLLGVTATSEAWTVAASAKLRVMIIGPSVRELIARDYLAAFKYLAPPTQIDLSCVRSARGDYRVDDLAAVFDQPSITGDCIEHYPRASYWSQCDHILRHRRAHRSCRRLVSRCGHRRSLDRRGHET